MQIRNHKVRTTMRIHLNQGVSISNQGDGRGMVDFCFSTFDMGWRGWSLAAIGMENANKEESKERAGVVPGCYLAGRDEAYMLADLKKMVTYDEPGPRQGPDDSSI